MKIISRFVVESLKAVGCGSGDTSILINHGNTLVCGGILKLIHGFFQFYHRFIRKGYVLPRERLETMFKKS